jgi:cytidylate kinase
MTHHIETLIDRQINRWNNITQLLRYAPGQSPKASAAEIKPGLRHPVICVSRRIGSGARAIVTLLGQRLGYEIFGSLLIDEIAKDLHVQRKLVDSLDETARGEVETMLESYLHGREISSEEYFRSLIRVVETLTLQGGVILLGRGTSFIVGHHAALRILITAPIEQRVKRLMEYQKLDEAEAHRRVSESDHQRHGFVQRYWKTDINDPLNYDLVINTERLHPADASALILLALEKRGFDLDRMTIHEKPAGKTTD